MTTPQEIQRHFHANDPLREAFKDSPNPERLWLMRAMTLTREECRTRTTKEKVRQIREAAARTVGIPADSHGYSYVNATPEQSAEIVELTRGAIAKAEEDDPKVQAANELYAYLSEGIDSMRGSDYDVVIRLTRWAMDTEGRNGDADEERVNDRVQAGFMGLYNIFCLGKGIVDD